MKQRLAIALLCVCPPVAAPAFADDATDAMRQAEALYRQGKLNQAYARLEDAATVIMRRRSAAYARTFPGAPKGWRALPVQSSAKGRVRLGRGIQLSRAFLRNGARGSATAKLTVDDQNLIAVMLKQLQAPETLRRMKKVPVRIKDGGTAYLQFYPRSRSAYLSMLVARRFYISVTVFRVDSPKLAIEILSGFDFAALKASAASD